LGFEAKISLEEGIRNIIMWFLHQIKVYYNTFGMMPFVI
jgi:hypothetical protein